MVGMRLLNNSKMGAITNIFYFILFFEFHDIHDIHVVHTWLRIYEQSKHNSM